MSRRRIRGFTLIELLVVIAIIGVLVALLLPAVQSAREAARRSGCQNNLKQHGLALQNHHAAMKKFPEGSRADSTTGSQWSTWSIQILPYMEETPLFEKYDQSKPNNDAANLPVLQTYMPVYSCPSDIGTTTPEVPASGPATIPSCAPGSYRAISGMTDNSAGDKYFDNPAASGTNINPTWIGVLHCYSTANKKWPAAHMGSVLDGTSKTAVVAEFHTKTQAKRRTFWAYTYTSYNQSSASTQRRTMIADYDKCVAIGGTGGEDACKRGTAAFHVGGMNALMADGAVRGLNMTNIDPAVWQGMATMMGGESVSYE